MKFKTEKDIITIIQQDIWMMNLLKAVSSLNLPDWWICAGFLNLFALKFGMSYMVSMKEQ